MLHAGQAGVKLIHALITYVIADYRNVLPDIGFGQRQADIPQTDNADDQTSVFRLF